MFIKWYGQSLFLICKNKTFVLERINKKLKNWEITLTLQRPRPTKPVLVQTAFCCLSWELTAVLGLWGREVQLLSSFPTSSEAVLHLASHELTLCVKSALWNVAWSFLQEILIFSVVSSLVGALFPFMSLSSRLRAPHMAYMHKRSTGAMLSV